MLWGDAQKSFKPSSDPGPFLGSLWALSKCSSALGMGSPQPKFATLTGCQKQVCHLKRPKYSPKNISAGEFQVVFTECSLPTAFPSL